MTSSRDWLSRRSYTSKLANEIVARRELAVRYTAITASLVLLCCGALIAGTCAAEEDENSAVLPQLHSISQHHYPPKDPSKPLSGEYRTPDGKKIEDAKTLDLIRNVQGLSRSKSSLWFFFTHPEFRSTDGTYAEITLADAEGNIIDPKMSRRTSLLHGRSQDSPGAIALLVFIPNEIPVPDYGTVRLHYTVGEWQQVSNFGLDRSARSYREKGTRLLAVGQDINQRTFVSLWVDGDWKRKFQYRPRAVLHDSTESKPYGRSEGGEPVNVSMFRYRVSLEDIQSFNMYRRPVQVMEIENVSFLPGSFTTPTYRAIDNRPDP
jgi:hypothetical protein